MIGFSRHPQPRFWWLRVLTPWRHESRWRRFTGSYALVSTAVLATSGIYPTALDVLLALEAGMVVLALVELVRNWREDKKYRRDKEILDRWGELITGRITETDLTPVEREEIAIIRAQLHLEEKES